MTIIAMVTCADQPTLTPDDELLGAALINAGHRWQAVPWTDATVDWSRFSGVLIRSAWDYHLRLDAFLAWVRAVEETGVPLWNPPATLEWNAHKGYLRQMAAAGIATVPTSWIARGETVDLTRIMADRGWTDVVVKPAVSATAQGVVRTSVADAATHDAALTETAATVDVLVQPFMPEIAQGELSIIFFGGEFSHAVRKRPKAGEFRVQSKFGGSVAAITPSPALIEQARAATVIAHDPVYARVDGLEVDGRLVIMELELIEPELFFRSAPATADRLVAAISRRLTSPTS